MLSLSPKTKTMTIIILFLFFAITDLLYVLIFVLSMATEIKKTVIFYLLANKLFFIRISITQRAEF